VTASVGVSSAGTGFVRASTVDSRTWGEVDAVTHHGESSDVQRYRQAAEQALDQLAWCVGYLNRIGKTAEAKGIAANRGTIMTTMRAASTQKPGADA
jgi:hypothetical protein